MKLTALVTLSLPCLLLAQTPPAPGEGQKPETIPVLDIPSYPVLRTDRQIRVDGSLGEWPDALPALLIDDPRQLSGTAHEAWRGQSDMAARGALIWDDERLYVSFFIRDDWPRALPRETPLGATMFPPCDHMEFFFDPLRNTRSAGPDPGRSEDREYVFGLLGDKRPFAIAWRRLHGTRYEDSKVEGVLLYDVRQMAWTLEASIPWSELLGDDAKPEEGRALDANFVFSDLDEPTDTLPQTRIGWTFGSNPVRLSPALHGTLILMGQSYDSKRPPERPRLPKTTGIEQPARATFEGWIDRLRALPAKPGLEGLASERGDLFAQLDAELGRYPLADTQQLIVLMQRRMQRELAGYLHEGAPSALTHAMLRMLEELPKTYDAELPTIRALPGRGFYVRSKEASLVFGGGFAVLERLAADVDAVCLSRAFEPMDRHDPLALRVFARKGAVFAHIGFHLHGYGSFSEHIVAPGQEGKIAGGVLVRALGEVTDEGAVTPSCGWQATWPNGFVLADAALSALPEQLSLPEGKKSVDVLLLDPRHPEWERWIEKAAPRHVLVQGFLDLPRIRGGGPMRNLRLAEARDFLRQLEAKGTRAWLLAPGQAWQPN